MHALPVRQQQAANILLMRTIVAYVTCVHTDRAQGRTRGSKPESSPRSGPMLLKLQVLDAPARVSWHASPVTDA